MHKGLVRLAHHFYFGLRPCAWSLAVSRGACSWREGSSERERRIGDTAARKRAAQPSGPREGRTRHELKRPCRQVRAAGPQGVIWVPALLVFGSPPVLYCWLVLLLHGIGMRIQTCIQALGRAPGRALLPRGAGRGVEAATAPTCRGVSPFEGVVGRCVEAISLHAGGAEGFRTVTLLKPSSPDWPTGNQARPSSVGRLACPSRVIECAASSIMSAHRCIHNRRRPHDALVHRRSGRARRRPRRPNTQHPHPAYSPPPPPRLPLPVMPCVACRHTIARPRVPCVSHLQRRGQRCRRRPQGRLTRPCSGRPRSRKRGASPAHRSFCQTLMTPQRGACAPSIPRY